MTEKEAHPQNPNPKNIPQELWDAWLDESKPIFYIDGTNSSVENGGWDIKNNKRLQSLIHQAAAILLPLCTKKIKLMAKRDNLTDNSDDDHAIEAVTEEYEQLRRHTNLELVAANNDAATLLERSKDFKQEIVLIFGSKDKLREKAQNFLAPVIRSVVQASNAYLVTTGEIGADEPPYRGGVIPPYFSKRKYLEAVAEQSGEIPMPTTEITDNEIAGFLGRDDLTDPRFR